jgi:hypothetical protein
MDKKQIIEDYLQGRHPMEQHSWELPSAQELERDEAEFDRLMEARNKPRRRLRLWPLAAAACVAGIIAIFLAPPRTTEQPPLALEEPVVTEQSPAVKEEPVKVEVLTQTETPSVKPKKTPKRKRVVPQEPIEEPMLAEAEINASHLGEVGRGALPEMKDPFLAIAQQMQDIRSRGEQVRQEVAQLIDSKDNLQ